MVLESIDDDIIRVSTGVFDQCLDERVFQEDRVYTVSCLSRSSYDVSSVGALRCSNE